MTGKQGSALSAAIAVLVVLMAGLSGCQDSTHDGAKAVTSPAAAPGSHPTPPATAPVAKGQDAKILSDQEKAVQTENSDGGASGGK